MRFFFWTQLNVGNPFRYVLKFHSQDVLIREKEREKFYVSYLTCYLPDISAEVLTKIKATFSCALKLQCLQPLRHSVEFMHKINFKIIQKWCLSFIILWIILLHLFFSHNVKMLDTKIVGLKYIRERSCSFHWENGWNLILYIGSPQWPSLQTNQPFCYTGQNVIRLIDEYFSGMKCDILRCCCRHHSHPSSICFFWLLLVAPMKCFVTNISVTVVFGVITAISVLLYKLYIYE